MTDILLQFLGLLMFTTDLTPQAWILVGLGLIGATAVVAILIGKAVSVWKDVLRK